MAHEIDYSTIADEYTRRETALKDLKKWVGATNLKKFAKALLAEKATNPNIRRSAEISMEMFQGVSGLPVEVWLDSLGIYPPTPNTAKIVADAVPTDPVKG